ncbi:MAG: hypothetical protein U0694_25070 [Anaerolineae bacterium]
MLNLVGHEGPVTGIRFNATGTELMTASLDGSARLWSASSGQQLMTLQSTSRPWAVSRWLASRLSQRVLTAC